MFGINLFKMAGIELPETEPGFEWVLLVMVENNRFESAHPDLQDAGQEMVALMKRHKDITHVSISKRVA